MELIGSEKKEKNEIELKIGISPEELDSAVNKAYLKNRNRIGVPGFRKGKAPRKIIEKMYGTAIFMNDALDTLLPDVMRFAMEDTEHDIVGYPTISDLDMKDDETRAEITLIAALHPEVILKEYKGLSAPKIELGSSDGDIEKELNALRERNARLETALRPAAAGDIAVIDFEGFIDGAAFEGGKGEAYELELGSGSFIPGFEEKIEGMTVDEVRDIDLVFPENYKEDLAGKPVVFKVKLLEVKEKQLPELDDEFAKDVSEFDTLDEFKASIREKIEKAKQSDIDREFEESLIEQIIDSMEADIPEAMIKEQMSISMNGFTKRIAGFGLQPAQYMKMTGLTPEEFEDRIRETSEEQVKIALALEKIAELEGVEVTDEEIDEEYKSIVKELDVDIEEVQKNVKRKRVISDLKIRKALKIVKDSAKIEEPENEPKTSDEKEKE